MRHPTEGQLVAYVDGELTPQETDRMRTHVEVCSRCGRLLAGITDRRARMRPELGALVGPLEVLPNSKTAEGQQQPVVRRFMSPEVARRRLAMLEASKDEEAEMPLHKRWFSRRYGPVWATAVVVVMLALSLLLPPVRAFAGDFLNLFRVQKIEVVEFSPTAMFADQGVEAAMQSLEQVMDEQVNVVTQGEPQEVDETTVRSLSSIQVRLPQGVEEEAHYSVQPAASISVKVDLPRVQALLAELGYADVDLPVSLDGADVNVTLAPSVIAAYGACQPNTEPWAGAEGVNDFDGACTVLVQMVSPSVSAPDGLDVDQLGQAYLQLLGMSASEAASFSERIDWSATLVLPLPRSEVTYEEVSVDGVTGVLVRPTEHRLPTSEYLMMWVKNDIVYALSGTGSSADALQLADSLQ